MCFWDVLGRFEVFGREIPPENEENGSEGLKKAILMFFMLIAACSRCFSRVVRVIQVNFSAVVMCY